MSPPREWQAVFDQTEQNWFVDDIHASNQRNEWYESTVVANSLADACPRYQESILIPFYVVALSTISAFVHAIHVKYKRSRSADGKRPQAETNSGTIPSPTALQRIRLAQGGSTILAFKVLRIALLYALFALSLWQNIISRRVRSSEEHGQKPSLGFFGLGSGIAVTPAYVRSFSLNHQCFISYEQLNVVVLCAPCHNSHSLSKMEERPDSTLQPRFVRDMGDIGLSRCLAACHILPFSAGLVG